MICIHANTEAQQMPHMTATIGYPSTNTKPITGQNSVASTRGFTDRLLLISSSSFLQHSFQLMQGGHASIVNMYNGCYMLFYTCAFEYTNYKKSLHEKLPFKKVIFPF